MSGVSRLAAFATTLWKAHRVLSIMVISAIVLLAVAVPVTIASIRAAADRSAPQATTERLTPSSTSATPSPASTEPPPDLPVGIGWTPVGRVLVASNGISRYDHSDTTVTINRARGAAPLLEVFVPGVGERSLDLSSAFPAGQVNSEVATVAGPTHHMLFVIVANERIPAVGLNPESAQVDIATFDLTTGALAYRGTLGKSTDPSSTFGSLSGSDTNVVAVEAYNAILGINAATGGTIWQMPAPANSGIGIVAAAQNSIVVQSDTSGTDGNRHPCVVETGVATATGDTLWSVDSTKVPATVDNCPSTGIDSELGAIVVVGFHDIDGTGGPGVPSRAFDAQTGTPLTLQIYTVRNYDPIRGYALNLPEDAFGALTGNVSVYDVHTGKTIYEIDQAKAKALNLRVVSLFDGYLYVQTTDGSPVIDVVTGKTIANSSSRYPENLVGSWTFYSDGTLRLDQRHF